VKNVFKKKEKPLYKLCAGTYLPSLPSSLPEFLNVKGRSIRKKNNPEYIVSHY